MERNNKSLKLNILYEDNHLIAVHKNIEHIFNPKNKHFTELTDLVKNYIRTTYNKLGKIYLMSVYELDVPETGVVLYCKTSKAFDRMKKSAINKKIKFTYWAVTVRRPKLEEGRLTHYLRRAYEKNIQQVFLKGEDNTKKVNIHYHMMGSLGNHHLLQVVTKNHEYQQVRAQLARINCPVRGDKRYGAPSFNKNKSVHTHLYKISFIHPVTKKVMQVQCTPSYKDDVWRMFEGIGETFIP